MLTEANNPAYRWVMAMAGVGRSMVSATGDEIEQAAMTALQVGEDAGQPDAFLVFAGQLFYARAAQGRLNELLDLVRQQAADNPGITAWQAALASTLTRLGHHNEVIDIVNELMVDPTRAFPRDGLWLTGHALLSEAVAVVGSVEQADREYTILVTPGDCGPSR